MEIFQIRDLIQAIDGEFIIGDPNLLVEGVSIDSRTIRKGEAYFAIKGERYDGHDFIKEAVEKGSSLIVYSNKNLKPFTPFSKFPAMFKTDNTIAALGKFAKYYRRKFKNISVVGVTGSNGKTTTKEILFSILNHKEKTLSNKGNFNNRIGLPLSIFNLTSQYQYAIFEIGTSLYGEIEILSDILMPDVAVITNIGFSHLETFVSPENVFKEKKVLFEKVKENGCLIINNDDKFLRTIAHVGARKIITFGLDYQADVTAETIKLFPDQTVFNICFNKESLEVFMPVRGKFNVYNALSAAACALGLGLSLKDIKAGIESFSPPKMRMETVYAKNGGILINDAYNANPSSMRNSIDVALQSYPDKKVNLVLADMLELGDKSDEYHFELGKFIGDKKINSINLLGDVIFNTKIGLGDKKNVFYSKSSDELLNNLKNIDIDENSVFLFKGSRGMKLEELFTRFYDFLER
ncbi:MAG: UDP-N-acetylmuramoyl-tripeptide--D-alanyl-D-alanine ligase [Endomicrobium sp.]|jgi:UDP-N-acetylmuramoyl-tripeptide--D-alanyl-D-alanine ligase|nr:UDP-N-acetylmuramoyl-tripeptide--D-alanyl-D-alanine ligase [Endomicrobium sp.]MDR2644969.1 UDP-N-acetylmuramoyl-tripeptide--D-alanyl-D-alanine ligase [Endomicrobium sp.]